MLYELHITTAPDSDVTRWTAVCAALGIKPLVIELDEGEHTRQVMMAARFEGTSSEAVLWRRRLEDAFRAAGFILARVKMEVPLDKAADFERPCYHEMHVKILCDEGLAHRLPAIAKATGLHLSRNALVPLDHGLGKWYLTARSYRVSYLEAGRVFGERLQALQHHIPSIRMEMETVISDTNPSLDDGWAV